MKDDKMVCESICDRYQSLVLKIKDEIKIENEKWNTDKRPLYVKKLEALEDVLSGNYVSKAEPLRVLCKNCKKQNRKE